MKKPIRYVPALAAAAALLASCVNMLDTPAEPGRVSGEKGRLAIRVEDGARTLLPSGTFDKYVLRFEYTGETGDYAHEPVEWNAGVSVDLEPGNWTVHADAYIGPVVSGTGSAAVTVAAGTITPVTIRVGLKADAGVKGTLQYKVSYPPAGTGHGYGTETLTVRDTAGNAVGSPVTITNGDEGSLELDPGVYFVGVMIKDTVQRTGAARTSAVHIYGEKETCLAIEIGEDELSALVPLVVMAGLTVSDDGPAVSSRAACVYGDAGCTDLLDMADTTDLTGQAEITLWAPSESLDVYVRQEIAVDGTAAPLKGKSVKVTIADPEQPATARLEDILYTVSLDRGIPAGTVTGAVPAAFEGNSVGVTVTPGDSRLLKAGTLKYRHGSAGSPLDGPGPDYTFAMPAADVTIQAEFHQFVRYGTAGGTGDGMSWDTASGDVQRMMDELAALSQDSATGYAGPSIVKLGAGTYLPQWEPMIPGPMTPGYAYTGSPGSRDAAFILREGVQVWGGYPADGGDETDEANRETYFNGDGTVGDPSLHQVILSGDLNHNDTVDAGDAYHVVLGVNLPKDDKTLLDGLTISGGCGDDSGSLSMDGGIAIPRNQGGGMYNDHASPKLIRVTISGNKADDRGGGIYNRNGSSPALEQAMISQNNADYGGGMYNDNSNLELNDKVSIHDNEADSDGGGVYVTGTRTTFTMSGTVTISSNAAHGDGGGVYVEGETFAMSGGTISGNKADVDGGGVYVAGGAFAMTGGTISGNEAAGNGGGVTVGDGTFTKTGGGVIYGDTDNTHTPGSDENTALSGNGHAVYVYSGAPKKRDRDVDSSYNLDSGDSAGWDP
ncbi:MAG: right-handed parallel beta-helix repeat-containing protein [Treponema sp.]|nr:right-handed parallel beta-helix repeat-containing protein [Treponema sp.]